MAPLYGEEEPETSLNPGENSNRKRRGKAQCGFPLPANRCLSSTSQKKKSDPTHVRKSWLPSSQKAEVEKTPPEKNKTQADKKTNLSNNEAYGCCIPSSLQ